MAEGGNALAAGVDLVDDARGVSVVADIEDSLVAQWSHFGRWPRGELHDEKGLLWFETPIRHLPYNGVLRTRLEDGSSADATISTVMERFRARDAQVFWAVHPSATPSDLAERLAAHGLRPVERMNCMSLELDRWEPTPLPDDVAFEEVVDDAGMEAYTELTLRYWEIPDDERELVAEVHRHWGPGRVSGHRYLARSNGEAIAKAYLSLAGPPGVGSIYGMSVVPEARGRGVAGGLTTMLLVRAREAGCHRAVLHSTDMAVGVYRRAGFVDRCPIQVFATASIWSDEH
jgi:GNAT superfamily N-acetyltransferase